MLKKTYKAKNGYVKYQRWAEKNFKQMMNVDYGGNAEAKRPIFKIVQ